MCDNLAGGNAVNCDICQQKPMKSIVVFLVVIIVSIKIIICAHACNYCAKCCFCQHKKPFVCLIFVL